MSASGESIRNQSPTTGVILKAYARPALRFSVAFVLFVFGLYLLQFSLSLHPPATIDSSSKVTIDSLPDTVSSTNIQLSGRYKPWKPLKVGVNNHFVSEITTSEDGHFKTNVSIAKRTNTISVWPVLPDGNPDHDAEASVMTTFKSNPPEPPNVQVMLEAPPEKEVLIGTTDPRTLATIENAAGQNVSYAYGGDTGMFAWQVSTAVVQNPGQYFVRFGPHSENRVTLASVLTQVVKSSISRSITVEFKDKAAEIELQVKAPLRVPQVRGLIAGELSEREFIHEIFGTVFPYPEDLLYGGAGRPQRFVAVTEAGEADVRLSWDLPFVPGQRDALLVDTETWRRIPLSHLGIGPSSEGLGQWPLLTSQDSFTVCFQDFHFDWTRPLPARLDAGEAQWKGPLQTAEIEMIAAAPKVPPPEKESSSEKQGSEETLTVREVLNDLRFPTLASTVGLTLIRSIPFVWLLLLLRANKSLMVRDANGEWSGRRRTTAACLIMTALSVWFVFYRVSFGLRNVLSVIPGSNERLREANSTTVFLALYLSFLVILRPSTIALEESAEKWLGWSGTGEVRGSSRWRRLCYWSVGVLLVVAMALLWQGSSLLRTLGVHGLAEGQAHVLADLLQNWNGALWIIVLSLALGWLSGWRIGAAFAALCTIAISMVSVAVLLSPRPEALKGLGVSAMAAVVQRLGHVSVAILLYAITLLVCMSLSYSLIPKRLSRSFARGLFIVVLGLLVPIFSFLPARWTNELSGFLLVAISLWLLFYVAIISPEFQEWLGVGQNSRLLWLSAAGVVLVLLVPQASHPGPVYAGQGFFSLLNEFIYFWAYVPLAGVLIWLHLIHRKHQSVPRAEELQLAYFVFSVYLVGYSAYWLYLPLPLIVGYIIARLWLIRDFPPPISIDGGPPSLKDTLAELIKHRSTERLARSVRKGQEKKLENGQISVDEYRKALEDLQAGPSESRQLGDRSTREVLQEKALAYGPTGEPWLNAILALRYAVLLSLVPSALAMYEFAASGETSFIALTFFLRMVLSFAYWLALAFFFGYFYRFIKGKSGLAKGIFMAAGVTFPYLCIRVIETQSLTEFRFFFFWAMQVFAFCTMLGLLCFDYETLRRNGFSFGDLLSLHNTPILSAFASSLLAVLVPSIIAIAKGEVLDLVKFLTERILPQIPVK